MGWWVARAVGLAIWGLALIPVGRGLVMALAFAIESFFGSAEPIWTPYQLGLLSGQFALTAFGFFLSTRQIPRIADPRPAHSVESAMRAAAGG